MSDAQAEAGRTLTSSPCKGCGCVNADVPGGGNRMCKGLEAWCVGLTEGKSVL